MIREELAGGLPPSEPPSAARDHTDDGMVSVPLETPSASSELQHAPADDAASQVVDNLDEQQHAATAGAGSPLAHLAGSDVMLDLDDATQSGGSHHDQPDPERPGVNTAQALTNQPPDAPQPPSDADHRQEEHAAANGNVDEKESGVHGANDAASDAAPPHDGMPDAVAAALAEAAASRRERDAALGQVCIRTYSHNDVVALTLKRVIVA